MVTPGDRIIAARGRKGWDQLTLAAKAGVDRVQISQWETGKRKPGAQSLGKLARALGVRIEWLKSGGEPVEAGPLDNLTIEDFQTPVGHGKAQPPARKPTFPEIDPELLQAAIEAAIDSNVPREQLAEVVIEAYRVTHRTKRVDQLPQLVKMLIS